MKAQEEIYRLLHARCEEAVGEMNVAYGRLCRSIAGNILSAQEDVEEVVSDAYFVAWSKIPPEKPDSLSAYLAKITRNLSLARLRRNTAAMRNDRLKVCLEELEECIPAPETPERVLERKLLTQAIQRFLDAQTQENRYVFVRRYYYLESSRGIAKATGLTDQAVRTWLMRLRKDLRCYLQKEEILI